MVFRWSLADLNNAVLWVIWARPPIFNFSSPLSKPLGTVPSAPITTGIIVFFMFHSFFISLERSMYLSLFVFFPFHSVVSQNGKVEYSAGSLFLLTIYYYHYYYYHTPLKVFHTSVSWGFLTGVWVTASLLKPSWLFSVFWLILIII